MHLISPFSNVGLHGVAATGGDPKDQRPKIVVRQGDLRLYTFASGKYYVRCAFYLHKAKRTGKPSPRSQCRSPSAGCGAELGRGAIAVPPNSSNVLKS